MLNFIHAVSLRERADVVANNATGQDSGATRCRAGAKKDDLWSSKVVRIVIGFERLATVETFVRMRAGSGDPRTAR